MKELFAYTVFSLIFNSEYKLLGPQDAGLNAVVFNYEEAEKELLSVTFVLFSKQDQENMEMNDSELLNYSKSIFLGTSKPANSFKERMILGVQSKGEIISTTIPVAAEIEVHFISLQNGDKISIGFKSTNEINTETKENIISNVFNSLK